MSGHITILDYLNEHCWNLVLGYVPLQDIIRTEWASRQWQQMVLSYLSNINIGIDIKNLRGESIYRDVTRTFPHIRWMTLKENFSTHHLLQSVESSKFEKYRPSFERWLCKLGASVVASYCFEWNFNMLGRHCPNLEGVMFLSLPEKLLLNNQYGNFRRLKQLYIQNCLYMTDGVLNQFITSPVLEELLISGNERVTGQCFSNITSPNLKSLDFQCCNALACRLLPAASDFFTGLTSLILKGINCSYIESNCDKEDEPFDDILLVLEKTKKLERLCIREFVQYELRKYVDGFFEAVCGLSCLRELDVDTPATDEVIEAVTRRCPELRILKFQNGSAVTGRGLAAACAQAGARLTELRLPCSDHLTDDDVVACILACPNLQILGLNASRRVTIALLPRAAAARRALHARCPLRLLRGRRGLIGYDGPRRPCSSCQGATPPPPCPPCESAPPPPCRQPAQSAVKGQRVVCCPPPQGQRPPCAQEEPVCSRTCAHPIAETRKAVKMQRSCAEAFEIVSQRNRSYKEHHRQLYEQEAAALRARPPPPRPAPLCPRAPERPAVVATDGRAYSVVEDAPAPRCSAAVADTTECYETRSRHPPPQPITLAPLGDCRPKDANVVDPCAHAPRTVLTIDRCNSQPEEVKSRRQAPAKPPKPVPKSEGCRGQSAPKPVQENPKSQTETRCHKGITSRIMESLRGGRTAESSGPPPKPKWCASPPPIPEAPPRCREPTLRDRMCRPPSPGKRQLHTAVADFSAKCAPKATRESALEASKKLAAALKERESLKEAGLGRSVRAPRCAPPAPPPPPPRPTGGAMEFSVPSGADTVCVRVSMGKSRCASSPNVTTKPATATAAPRATIPRPPCAPQSPPSCGVSKEPTPKSVCSDSWLSIKKIQQKISSCGHDAPAAPPAAANPKSESPRPKPKNPCDPKGRAKMMEVLPHTIFVK